MKVLLTGETGYLGRHLMHHLKSYHYSMTTDGFDADCVLHFIGMANIPDSIRDPLQCYESNVAVTIQAIRRMQSYGVKYLVFPSTNAINGDHPYGRSKRMCEEIIKDSGLKYAILRYFNVAGASVKGEWRHNYRLIPMLLHSAKTGEPFSLYGDGQQVRDYIHVDDACKLTIAAMEELIKTGESFTREIGAGHGHSVREVIDMVEKVTGKKIDIKHSGGRAGDADVLVAKIPLNLPHSSLENIIHSAWEHL